jgi:hypothetical protein
MKSSCLGSLTWRREKTRPAGGITALAGPSAKKRKERPGKTVTDGVAGQWEIIQIGGARVGLAGNSSRSGGKAVLEGIFPISPPKRFLAGAIRKRTASG